MKPLGMLGRPCALACFAFCSVPAAAQAEDGRFILRSQMAPGAGLRALQMAVAGARRRLDQPGCRDLFGELSDVSGRKLQESLDALGHTPSTYLGLILFADASRRPRCKAGGVFAFTTPNSRVVFVCGAQLAEAAGRNLGLVEAVLIHEELHSLGLGENPPTSEEITARVQAACPL